MSQDRFSHRTMQILLAFCLISIILGLSLFFPPPPLAHAATITVQSSADGSAIPGNCPGSGCRLRDAIAAANLAGGDTIDFSLTYPATITLTSGELVITKSLTINGPGAISLTISGNNVVRVMSVNSGVTLNLSKVTIANGNSGSGGGGIYNSGMLSVTSTTFYSNTANVNIGGGGIFNDGSLGVTDSTFLSNGATGFAGGGGIANGGALTITASTFLSNTALQGGGIFNSFVFGKLAIINSTFSGNSASDGGSIYNIFGVTATITNATFSSNSASGSAGGIFNSGTMTLGNTIVANNIAASGGNCFGTIGDGGNNLQWNPNSGCASITAADPKLGPLANNGGATQTMALLPGSAAIDAGNDANCPGTDQRGWHRPFGPHCDIGAYERGAFLYLPLILK